MPTRARPEFAAAAVQLFLAQDWPEKELIILDDSDCPSFAEPPQVEGVRYFRMAERLAIGSKRNICCSRSKGDVIAHWDDDDWSAPNRLSHQAEMLMLTGADVVGFHSMAFKVGDKFWRYEGCEEDYALGTSLMYRYGYWEANPFHSERNVGEDHLFIAKARAERRIACTDASRFMYALNHGSNTDKRESSSLWREIENF